MTLTLLEAAKAARDVIRARFWCEHECGEPDLRCTQCVWKLLHAAIKEAERIET